MKGSVYAGHFGPRSPFHCSVCYPVWQGPGPWAQHLGSVHWLDYGLGGNWQKVGRWGGEGLPSGCSCSSRGEGGHLGSSSGSVTSTGSSEKCSGAVAQCKAGVVQLSGSNGSRGMQALSGAPKCWQGAGVYEPNLRSCRSQILGSTISLWALSSRGPQMLPTLIFSLLLQPFLCVCNRFPVFNSHCWEPTEQLLFSWLVINRHLFPL